MTKDNLEPILLPRQRRGISTHGRGGSQSPLDRYHSQLKRAIRRSEAVEGIDIVNALPGRHLQRVEPWWRERSGISTVDRDGRDQAGGFELKSASSVRSVRRR